MLKQPLSPWYMGVKGGIPFGMSTFSSFGEGGTRLGYNVGVLAGYSLSPVFSLELSAMFGQMELGLANDGANYWLGSDGIHYKSAVVGADGYYYKDLYSSVELRQYGLHLNIDLLPVFNCKPTNRFSLVLSPAVYGIETQATLRKTSNEEQFIRNERQFNLGVGGDLSVAYRLTENLAIRLSSGVNYAIGRNFDGVPSSEYIPNIILNNDISFRWRFGRRKRKATVINAAIVTPFKIKTHTQVVDQRETTQVVAVEKSIGEQILDLTMWVEIEDESVVADVTLGVATTLERSSVSNVATGVKTTKRYNSIIFPSVFYGFSSVEIASGQVKEVAEIVKLMNDNPEVMVGIIGFTTKEGSLDRNNIIIQKSRASNLRDALIGKGIDASRIKAVGVEVDPNAKTEAQARRVDVIVVG